MTVLQAGGYRLTERAQAEAQMSGLTQNQVHRILADTVDQVPVSAELWKVTDGKNTLILSPLDSVITSVSRGSQKKPVRR
ncbi:hypothetical protein M2272_005871 [Mycobacterium frederiksbergense]|uniref:Uncharacterized protein n=1 Tax=Mycolicibacterium frederiksbergense TaxID=117567 RepID=A0ABT6L8J5_9MYCO|nr:hypothetical protein [Mycolicibacterium frederiksbergense]MDH6199203.1 hypothetical protein [Mycolicibacterium frederiksbergense]